jgi:hypothetical protein
VPISERLIDGRGICRSLAGTTTTKTAGTAVAAVIGGIDGYFGTKLYTWPSLVAVTTRRSWPIETPTGYPVAWGSG